MSASQRASRPSTEALRAPDRRRLYEQLAARLLDYVEVTGLRVGGRLPSERDLAEALKVSRASVRQATVALEVRGTLEVRHGDGIYLRSLPNDSGHLMELMTARHRLPAILEAREALETQLATLAAAPRTALAGPIGEPGRSSLGERGRPPLSLRAHRRILEAIRRGDAAGARRAMR